MLSIAATAELILQHGGYEFRLSRLLDSQSVSDFYRQFVAILMQYLMRIGPCIILIFE